MTEQSERRGAEPPNKEDNHTWTFRGYRLDPAHFTTAMIHFYRAEVTRANTWRTRLDTTTNWAVITTAAALTFVFGAPQNPHYVLILVLLLVFTFLYIEARRYRYYVLWAYRVHLMETDFFAAMLAPPFRPSADWADHLVESLQQPTFRIGRWEAIGWRFRRNYVWLITLLLISWGAKLALHPLPALDWATVVKRAAFGAIPGVWVISAVGVAYALLAALAVNASISYARRESPLRPVRWLEEKLRQAAGPLVPKPHPWERLAIVITARGRRVSQRLLTELGRGVTALEGIGMYTDQARDVLLCAVTDVQVSKLEEIAHQVDPMAFVVISPAEEVRGKGFRSFEAPS
jgi:uncharacterized membrane protein